jgi:predicted ATPase
MHFKSFKAKNVFGYLPFEINFNEELNFLIGSNGSGKTTVLRLIDALLSVRIRDLVTTKYDFIEITFIHAGSEYTLGSKQFEKTITLKLNDQEINIPHPNIFIKSKWRYDLYGENDPYEGILNNLKNETLIKEIKDFPRIQFLSLDRNVYSVSKNEIQAKTKYSLFGEHSNDSQTDGSYLTTGFHQARMLISDEFKRVRSAEKKLEENLRSKFLSSSFNYIMPDQAFFEINENINSNEKVIKRIESFLNRKNEFTSLIFNLFKDEESSSVEKSNNLEKRLLAFFKSLEMATSSLRKNKESKGVSLEIMMNYGQILRLEELNKIVNDFNDHKRTIYRRINKFLDAINYFFADSGKKIEPTIDGGIKISTKKENFPIEGLSSGEIHLFVIFAFLGFSKNSKSGAVIFIDEPELSLHLNWQENLVDKMVELNSNTQLIIATLSPEIVAGYKDYCTNLNIKK